MNVPIAYLCVVVIWSTTPLGIVWSSETVDPMMAALLRMSIAALLGTLFLLVLRIRLPFNRLALRLYTYSVLGVFGGMACGYMASRHIGSGVISLVFGLSPVVSGLLSQRILNEAKFSTVRIMAFTIALLGLAIVCWDSLSIKDGAATGITFVLLGMFLFSLSAVLVKSIRLSIHPLATTLGSVYLSIPLYFLAWLFVGGELNTALWSLRSISSIIYLGVFGSLLGFIAYFFILQKLNASTVALVTLITPAFAISLGALVNDEQISLHLIIGASCILIGLSMYHWGEKYLLKYRYAQSID